MDFGPFLPFLAVGAGLLALAHFKSLPGVYHVRLFLFYIGWGFMEPQLCRADQGPPDLGCCCHDA